MDKDVSELSIDELTKYINETQDVSWKVLNRLVELWNKIPNEPVDNKHKIKQLKQRARYSKNPLEVKRLNQEIMVLQRGINKERKTK
jgi:hypothetical protein